MHEILFSSEYWGYCLILFFILSFLVWILHQSNHLVIEPFQEDTEKDRQQGYLNGPLNDLLASEIYRILKLYGDVDNQRPISTSMNVVSTATVNVRVEDVSDMLENVVSESAITIGPLKVPVRIILSFFGRFIGSKKIQSSILSSREGIIIIASMTGGNHPYTWRVQRPDPIKHTKGENNGFDPDGVVIKEMIEELAYRIFTDLTDFHSNRWEATKEFMLGLECYRNCLLSPADQITELKKSEAAFIKALKKDVTFSSAWFNLGVVYTELHFFEAARVAFYKSFSNKPDCCEAYYALALNLYNQYLFDPAYGTSKDPGRKAKWKMNLKDATFFCSHANILKKNDPEIQLLSGRLNLELYYLVGDSSESDYLARALDAFRLSADSMYRVISKENLIEIRDVIATSTKRISHDKKKKIRYLHDILGDLGWGYLEYAAREKIRERRKDALDAALMVFYEILFSDHSLVKKNLSGQFLLKKMTHLNEDNLPDSLLFWKCGVLHLCRQEFDCADVMFSRALVINPSAFLFQASHILGKVLLCKDQEEANPQQSRESDKEKIRSFWWYALQYAYNAYRDDKKDNDYQWGYLAESIALVGQFLPDCQNRLVSIRIDSGSKRNRFSDLVKQYSFCGVFGRYIIKLFGIYEILDLLLAEIWDNTWDMSKGISFVKSELYYVREVDPILRMNYPAYYNHQGIMHDQESYPPENSPYARILAFFKECILKKQVIHPEFEQFLSDDLTENWKWIVGQYYLAVGQQMVRNHDLKNAQTALKNAEILADYDLEFGHRGILALQSKVHTDLGETRTAFAKAWQAHWIDPTNSYEHIMLSLTESAVSDYSNAIKSLEEAEHFNPKLVTNQINIAQAYYNLFQYYPHDLPGSDSQSRLDYLKKALDHLYTSLSLAKFEFQQHRKGTIGNNLDELLTAYFWIGMINLDSAKYPEAVENFAVVKKLALSEILSNKTEYHDYDLDRAYPAFFFFALTMRFLGEFSEAEGEFLELLKIGVSPEILAVLDDKAGKKFTDEQIRFLDKSCGIRLLIGNLTIRKLMFKTFLEIARCRIERSCIEEEVDNWIDRAENLIILSYNTDKILKTWDSNQPGISGLRPDMTHLTVGATLSTSTISDDQELNEYFAEITKMRGLIKLHQYARDNTAIEDAQKIFTRSFCYYSDPETCIFLLRTLYLKLQSQPIKEPGMLSAFLGYCEFLKKTGIPLEYFDYGSRMIKQADEWSKSPATPPV